jgi:predicted nucleic acid-binding protein
VPQAISNTSPLLYLWRIDRLDLLPALFDAVWLPAAVVAELQEGRQKGYSVPNPSNHGWLEIVDPNNVPSEWLIRDLGKGELAAMALGLENPARIVLLDDALARQIAAGAGLKVWGTLRVLLEAKSQGLLERVGPLVGQLRRAGMWVSDDVQRRILVLAEEI